MPTYKSRKLLILKELGYMPYYDPSKNTENTRRKSNNLRI